MSKEQIKKQQLSPVKHIPLDSIDPSEQAYQTRFISALRNSSREQAGWDSTRSVKALVAELKVLNEGNTEDYRQGHLKPIVVWREPGTNTGPFIIVSGFHRYAAYVQFNKSQPKRKRKKVIPAQLFIGTQDEAAVYSSEQNTKPEQSKSMEQKRNAAWALIRSGNVAAAAKTVRELAMKTGISKSLIHQMRSTQRQLQADPSKNTYDNWRIQQMSMKGKEPLTHADMEDDLVESIASRAYRNLVLGDCKADRTRALRVLRELAKRLSRKGETLDDLLGITEECDF
jgi:hypothetical protein